MPAWRRAGADERPLNSPGRRSGAALCDRLASLLDYVQSGEVVGMRHGDLERELEVRGRELMRTMFQELLDSRSSAREREPVRGADGLPRTRKRLQERC